MQFSWLPKDVHDVMQKLETSYTTFLFLYTVNKLKMDLEIESNEVSSIVIEGIIDDIIKDIIPYEFDNAKEDQGKLKSQR